MAKTISEATLNKIYKFQKDEYANIEFYIKSSTDDLGKPISVQVKRHLALNEVISFVNDVVIQCYDEGDSTYSPELFDYVLRRSVLAYYTNLPIRKMYEVDEDENTVNGGMTHEDVFNIVYGTSIYDDVIKNIHQAQFKAMCESISSKIEYLKQQALSTEHTMLSQVSQKMNDVSASISAMFDGIDIKPFADSVTQLANQIGDLPKEQLVSTIVDTIKSDVEVSSQPLLKVFDTDGKEIVNGQRV